MSIYHSDAITYQKKVCPICKRLFCVPALDVWRYKREGRKRLGNYGQTMYFDRYSCLREYDKQYPQRRRKVDIVDEYAI